MVVVIRTKSQQQAKKKLQNF